MENYIGRLLDNRYEILEQIGSGGMAVVYRARCHRLNRLVAIKILKEELGQDEEFRRRFHAESQAVAMLSHSNIVGVYDVSHSEYMNYIVMELIDGITLKQYMQQKGTLNWREALHFSTQIAKALEHAHSRGIIHRDIKPHNIMILKDGTVKVADFGIARVSSAQSTLTREALGSVHYISPEQAKGSKIDYRSDLYSLGVVMYEMLTGQPPYDGETPVSVAIKHINANAQPPRAINPQIPIGLAQITMHAMSADLDERYESATDLISDLDEFRRNPNINFIASASVDPTDEPRLVSSKTDADRAVRGSIQNAKREVFRTPSSKRTNSIALVAGIICIALALIFVGYFLYSFFFADYFTHTAEIQVPYLENKLYEDIVDDYPNFQLHIEEWAPSDTYEMGRIISQDPAGGKMAKSGAIISLRVSSGPSTDTMRYLINYTEKNAKTILDNLGLNLDVVIEYETSDLINEGAVIRTDPAADEPLSNGQTVVLVVSAGPDLTVVPVPELVGMDIEEAKKKLDSLDLKYNIGYYDSKEPKGTVIFQSVKQMEMVRSGTTINLQVSNGPEEEIDDPQTSETDTPDEHTKKVIWIPFQPVDENESVVITVKVDDVVVDEFPLETSTISSHGLPIAPDVNGIHSVDVYIDGVLYYSLTYNFDTGEQLS